MVTKKTRSNEEFRKYADQIAYWVSEPDEGIYDAMNEGFNTTHSCTTNP